MLVLSRKPGDQVVIGDGVVVTVVAVKGDRVQLGFEAPREVPIRRAELAAAAPGSTPAPDMTRGSSCRE